MSELFSKVKLRQFFLLLPSRILAGPVPEVLDETLFTAASRLGNKTEELLAVDRALR